MSKKFATTQWSQVLAAKGSGDTQARRALEELCSAYWYPLYAYLRHQGYGPNEAADLTQGYFAELLGKDFLEQVDPAKGRFRSFLLASLRHFVSRQRQKAGAQKRGGGVETLSIDTRDAETRFQVESLETLTPERLFERRWAMTVLERAMAALEREALESGTDVQFERFKPYLTGQEPHLPYRQVAADLGMSEGAVKTAVYRLRRRYGAKLRAEIEQTVADPAEVDQEVRHLLACVSSP
ncbi:MAG: ECF-type sigma factor [Acidobacteriota bacterium]